MHRKTLAALVVAAMITLAGCSAVLGSAEFESSVDDVDDAVIDEEYELTVAVENVGDADGDHDVEAEIAGEIYTESINLNEGESTTVTFTHTFGETGEESVVVDGEEVTVDVVEPLDAIAATMANVSSVTTDEEMEMDLTMVYEGWEGEMEEEDIYFYEGAEVTYDFDAEKMHLVGEEEIDMGWLGTEESERKEWYVDGALYTKTEEESTYGDDVTYSVESKDFDEAVSVDFNEIIDGLSEENREDTGDTYVYTVSLDDEDAIQKFAEATGEDDFLEEDEDVFEDFNLEVVVNKNTHHISTIEMEMELEDEEESGEEFSGDVEFHVEFENYNEDVTIEIPDDVMDEFEPSASVYITQNDNGDVIVRATEMEAVDELTIELNGETADFIRWDGGESMLWNAEDGDEITVTAEPEADDVFDSFTVDTYTVGE